MGNVRTLGQQTLQNGVLTPVVLNALANTKIQAASFSITGNIATIVLGSALPADGYNPGQPNTVGGAGLSLGQQVTLWGFSTATYFNGTRVTVISNTATSFSFTFAHANVGSTNDAGWTAPALKETPRWVAIEIDQAASTGIAYIGDLNTSSTQYYAALTLPTSNQPWSQVHVEIGRDKFDPMTLMATTGATAAKIQVSLIY